MTTPLLRTTRSQPDKTQSPISIGCLLYPGMDQIDFTGPFEVLSRMPNTKIQTFSHQGAAVRDVQGLLLQADVPLSSECMYDVLLVPGGYGQQELMEDEQVHELIRRHYERERVVFSVCTGALLCGAAGILEGRSATTHWSTHPLLKSFGATPIEARVVVDGNLLTAAGVTAGLDGALVLVSLLRGEAVAEQIQLAIEYNPQPIFSSGSPGTAPSHVLEAFEQEYTGVRQRRREQADHYELARRQAEDS